MQLNEIGCQLPLSEMNVAILFPTALFDYHLTLYFKLAEYVGILGGYSYAYFSQIGQTTSSSVPRPSQPMAVRLPRVHTGGFRVDTVDIETLMTVVHGMKPSTSTAHGRAGHQRTNVTEILLRRRTSLAECDQF